MCLSVSYIIYYRDMFHSLFENATLGSMESFFQLSLQINISLYLMKAIALHHYRESADFDAILSLKMLGRPQSGQFLVEGPNYQFPNLFWVQYFQNKYEFRLLCIF